MDKKRYDAMVDGLAKLSGTSKETAAAALADLAPRDRDGMVDSFARFAGVDRETAADALADVKPAREAAPAEAEIQHAREIARLCGLSEASTRAFLARLAEKRAAALAEPKPDAKPTRKLPRPGKASARRGYIVELKESGTIIMKGGTR